MLKFLFTVSAKGKIFKNFISYSLFFILGPCYLNVLQVIYHIHTYYLMNIITYTTVNIDVRTTDLNIAYPHEDDVDDDPSMSK
jgi:hypothetical protein